MYALIYNQTNEYLATVIYKPFIKYFTTTNVILAIHFDSSEEAENYLIRTGLDDSDFTISKFL